MGNFVPRLWRGDKYYLIIARSNHSTSLLSNIEIAYGLYDHSDYWIKVYKKYFYADSFIEEILENYAGAAVSCNDTIISLYKSMNSSHIFNITNLHPSIDYELAIIPCNEFGCGVNSSVILNTSMPSFKPCIGPTNISLSNTSTTSFYIKWNEIDFMCQYGEILFYTVFLNITRKKIVITQNSTKTNISFNELLDAYEHACVFVAGWTEYPEMGALSNAICGYTEEDGLYLINYFICIIKE